MSMGNMKVYLVEDHGDSPGRIYAVFVRRIDADEFAQYGCPPGANAQVEERTLFDSQPPRWGYNQ
jgi:hypothetical protein